MSAPPSSCWPDRSSLYASHPTATWWRTSAHRMSKSLILNRGPHGRLPSPPTRSISILTGRRTEKVSPCDGWSGLSRPPRTDTRGSTLPRNPGRFRWRVWPLIKSARFGAPTPAWVPPTTTWIRTRPIRVLKCANCSGRMAMTSHFPGSAMGGDISMRCPHREVSRGCSRRARARWRRPRFLSIAKLWCTAPTSAILLDGISRRWHSAAERPSP